MAATIASFARIAGRATPGRGRTPPSVAAPTLARGQRRTVVDVVGGITRLGLPACEAFHFHPRNLTLDQTLDAGEQLHFLAVHE